MTRKTLQLRERLAKGDILIAPGAYDALLARLIALAGFECVYFSGAGTAYSLLGEPDVGLLTMTEMAERATAVAQAVVVPVIADGDNGYGNAINVMRTVREYERAGVAAIQLEDQETPKRCGHLSGRRLIGVDEMVGKLRAAQDARRDPDFVIIARTDACGVLGLDEALRRGEHYVRAGADVLFIESPRSVEDLAKIGRTFRGSVPLLANMVEGGQTPLLSASELQELGFRIVIFPNSLTRRIVHAARELLRILRTTGTTADLLAEMVDFKELNMALGLGIYEDLESKYLPPN
ncbi:MAG: isocitrate lyase/PEP mutase family protein [Chloroflexota bacterium]